MPVVNVTTTSQAIAANTTYRPNNAGLVTLTLPSTAVDGSIVQVTGVGSGGWRVAQLAGQQIVFGNRKTAVGASGRIDSTHARDCVTLECVVANTTWEIIGSQGNIDISE
jgi:hypothetical protein